ncbi:MAG TPA: 50S ribosomal protein L10 [Gammaproteobacteria bacterium]|nr:50S ribosomal protein L10 [Gammaproteobacteria bacterium]
MPLNLEQKKAVVAEIAEVAAGAHSAVAAEYQGLTVEDLTVLRKKARESGVYMRVIKNTLARRAVIGTDFECMQDGMVGPLVYAFSQEDPGSAARVMRDFVKDHEKLVVKLVAMGGKLLGPGELKRIADLPTREQALSLLLAVMRAPLDKFARTLNEVPGKLVRTLAAIKDSKSA